MNRLRFDQDDFDLDNHHPMPLQELVSATALDTPPIPRQTPPKTSENVEQPLPPSSSRERVVSAHATRSTWRFSAETLKRLDHEVRRLSLLNTARYTRTQLLTVLAEWIVREQPELSLESSAPGDMTSVRFKIPQDLKTKLLHSALEYSVQVNKTVSISVLCRAGAIELLTRLGTMEATRLDELAAALCQHPRAKKV